MPRKRALSPPPDLSSSSSPSSSRQLCARFQLLHDLPAPLFAAVCSFLTVYQVVSVLRSTCRAVHDSVLEDCLLHHHLSITDRTLPSLLSSQPSTRALLRRISSLTIYHRWRRGEDTTEQSLMPVLPSALQAALDASLLQFSSVSSLYINVEEVSQEFAPTPPKLRSLLSLLQLLAANPQLFSSLRRLHIEDNCDALGRVVVPLPVPELGRLQGLTHCRIRLRNASALSCESLVSALSSMQCLTCLHLGDTIYDVWPELLPLLCADAAIPLLLRLKSLVLPPHSFSEGLEALYEAFLCRLSSLPASPALQHFSGMHLRHRAAGLLSLFSLPHLRLLTLPGVVRRSELSAFASSFTCAPAPLVSLELPHIQPEPDDEKDEAAVAEEAAAVRASARLLLSRLPSLRHLSCDAAMASGAISLPDSLSSDGTSGCCASLYSLTVFKGYGRPSRCPFTARLSFPLLTDLNAKLTMTDAELELLLSGCPQLLVLSCTVWSSCWRAVLIAARCCPRLLRLVVQVDDDPTQPAQRASDQALAAATAAAEPDISGPFLPELVSLSLYGDGKPLPPPELSLLRHFITSPPAELRYVTLVGVGLTAQHVLSLACLSGLSYLWAREAAVESGRIAEVSEARIRAERQLLSRRVAASPDCHAHSPGALREYCESGMKEPPLGPHQQQEMRLYLVKEADAPDHGGNLLDTEEGVDRDTARAVFFAELRSVLTAAAAAASASRVGGGKGRQ